MSLVGKSWAVPVAAVAVLLLGGCAESDDELSGSKARLAAEADPICKDTRAKVGDLGGDPAAERDAVQSGVDRLGALTIPGEDEAKYKVFLAEVQNLALSLEDVVQSREAGDGPRAATALTRAGDTNERVKKAGVDYGFTECSQGLAT